MGRDGFSPHESSLRVFFLAISIRCMSPIGCSSSHSHTSHTTPDSSIPLDPLDWESQLSLNLFRHIHGDRELIEDTTAGMVETVVLAWLQIYCQKESPKILPLLQLINLANHRYSIEAVQSFIDRLEANKRALMMGGWPGHVLLYYIERHAKNYSFYVFNTGDGVEFHPEIQNNGKTMNCPFLWYPDITREQINQILIPMVGILSQDGQNPCPSNSEPSSFLYEQVWEKILGPPKKNKLDFFITPQRSGTCAYRVFLAWLQFALGRPEYKIWHHALHVNTIQAMTKRGERAGRSSIEAFWLDIAIRNTLYSAAKLLQNRFITEKMAQITLEICNKARTSLSLIPLSKRISYSGFFFESEISPYDSNEESEGDISDSSLESEEYPSDVSLYTWIDIVTGEYAQPFDALDPISYVRTDEGLVKSLQTLYVLFDATEALQQSTPLALLAIDHVIRALPLDTTRWDENLIQQHGGVIEIVRVLQVLHESYVKILSQETHILPRHVHTSLRIIALIHVLVCLDVPSIGDYCFSLPEVDRMLHPSLVYFDPLDWQQSHELWNFFQKIQQPNLNLCEYIPYRNIVADDEGKTVGSPLFHLHRATLYWQRWLRDTLPVDFHRGISHAHSWIPLISRQTEDLEQNSDVIIIPRFRIHDRYAYAGQRILLDLSPEGACWYRENPLVMIQDVLSNVFILDQPRIQTLFEHILFQSTQNISEVAEHPLQEMIQNHVELLINFLERLEQHQITQPKDQMSFRLFWVRCAQRLCRIHSESFRQHVISQIPFMQTWLHHEHIDQYMHGMIHLYLAHAYSVLGIDTLSDQQIQALIISWVSCHNLSNKEVPPDIMPTIRSSFIQNKKYLWACIDSDSYVLHPGILGVRQEDPHLIWRKQRNEWTLDISSPYATEYYSIHLLSLVYRVIEQPDSTALYEFCVAKRLFDYPLIAQRVQGKYILGIQREYGQIRAWYSETHECWMVERLVGGHWYGYIDPEIERPATIPFNLWWTHSHWLLLHKEPGTVQAPCIVVSPLMQGKIVYEISIGSEEETPQYYQKINPTPHLVDRMSLRPILGNCVEELSEELTEIISPFESPRHVWMETNQGCPKHLVFPRFKNEEGNMLQFYFDHDEWRMHRGPNFYLQPCAPKLPHLGDFCNFLYLTSDQDKALLLVPVHPADWSRSFDLHIDFALPYYGSNIYEESLHGQFEYVVLEWSDGRVVPRSPKASCFLAYLYFVHRAYVPAAELLQHLLAGPPLSLADSEILKFFSEKNSYTNSTPSAAAIRLHVIALKKRAGIQLDFGQDI